MNANHILFWEVFLSICSICLVIALGTHFWFLRKRKRAWRAAERTRIAQAKKKKARRTRKRQRRK